MVLSGTVGNNTAEACDRVTVPAPGPAKAMLHQFYPALAHYTLLRLIIPLWTFPPTA